jgi:hypothetical protein
VIGGAEANIDHELYVLDFGRFEMTADGNVAAEPSSGCLWRIAAR